eukprot:1366221-Alexandrium_andersonii.AAC.1
MEAGSVTRTNKKGRKSGLSGKEGSATVARLLGQHGSPRPRRQLEHRISPGKELSQTSRR